MLFHNGLNIQRAGVNLINRFLCVIACAYIREGAINGNQYILTNVDVPELKTGDVWKDNQPHQLIFLKILS